ncbi:hypothetical protein [Marinigracilibium pacificum]|uniref:Uncharacterized protein n=1 Tax=Marinigracilibium pacificum TaxID=2729599 RepID=A0A848IS51_9BACT|nr:hypothetical protein [Marinigracilibium pacificum]NMM47177.1 hypothetical protein [Marinigracilibium pacificum]
MKVHFIVAILLFSISISYGQTWTNNQEKLFINSCKSKWEEVLGKETDKFCSCSLEKAQIVFSSFEASVRADASQASLVYKGCLDGHPWPEEDQKQFLNDCITNNDGDTTFCSCILEKLGNLYPTPEIAGQISDAEVNDIAESCEFSADWSEENKNAFLEQCAATYSQVYSDEKTGKYCNCVLNEMQSLFETFDDMNKNLTEQGLTSIKAKCLEPDFSKWTPEVESLLIQDCQKDVNNELGDRKALEYCRCFVEEAKNRFETPEKFQEATPKEFLALRKYCFPD